MLAERLIAQMIAKRASQRAQEAPTQPFNNQVARTQEPLGETIESTLSATLTEVGETKADSLEDKEKMTSKSISPPDPVGGLPPPDPVGGLPPPDPADAATDNVDNEEPMPMLVDESDDEFEEAGYLNIYGHSTSSIASAAPKQWMNARKLRTDPNHVLTRESILQEFATKTQAALDYIILQGELSADLSPGNLFCSRLMFHF